ncbi:unnamed protein product [Durusdinium trenchii]|uniref:Glycoside hydrolase family 31 TIM barrel domain-containing protein n=2 Tax=Durusdinium trenchii TaxID=1381693 RepID=A0ABP0SJF0_9DINO
MVRAMVMWFLLPQVAGAWKEHVLELPDGGRLGLSTRGRSLRVRWPPGGEDIREVSPADPDAAFHVVSSADGEGIAVPELGSLALSKQGLLQLRDARGALLTQTEPLGRCRALKGQRPQGGHVLRQATLDAGACCQACLQDGNCTDWSTSRGTCVLLKDAAGWYADEGAMAGRPGLIIFNSSTRGLYGRGAGPADAEMLLAEGSAVSLANRATYVPYFYSRDGYAVLGHSNVTHFNMMAVRYQSFPEQGRIAWAFEGAFQLHFMLAPSLAEGTKAYYALTGRPPVPPRHAFGFMACRWGWPNQRYLEETVQRFREGHFPLDSVILDFEWFANSSDYAFTEQGEAWYEDFGWNPELFPSPAQQLKTYLLDQQLFVAGIRKPRLGNRQLLHLAKERKWIAPEGGPETYAKGRWLRFSDPTMQRWYAQQMQHYVDSGISFWWNDEGENFYYTYHEWNLAEHQLETEEHRFFSLNRAFTPGMARLGTGVWTGDVGSTWEDLRKTPGMMLNWALAGAPYVACDIGGFFGNPSSELLTRWFQVGTFMPLMRTHSHHDSVPHWPWLYPDGEIMYLGAKLGAPGSLSVGCVSFHHC